MAAAIYTLLTTLLLAVALAAVIRRTLGTRVGWPRTVVIAVVALVAGVPLAGRIAVLAGLATSDGRLLVSDAMALLVLGLASLWVFVAALAAVMLWEVLLPTGSLPGPRAAVLGVRSWLRRTVRYLQITRAMAGSGLGGALRTGPDSPAFGPALARAFNRCGVTFVKLGQILATRDDLLPVETTRALARLQSDADPIPFDTVRATLAAELPGPLETYLSRLDPDPLAAASVAQVHTATTADGHDVVVKVQRASASVQVMVDTDIVTRLAATAEQRFAWAREMGVGDLANGLARSLREELDYTIEASRTSAGAAALASHPDIVVPAIHAELCSRRVLVMDRLRGRPLSAGPSAIEGLTAERRSELAQTLVGAVLDTVFVAGVFHADLHPGNIMILQDGRVGVLDFGAVGVLDSETRQLLALLLLAIVSDDAVAAADAMTLAFDTPPGLDLRRLRRDLGREIAVLQLQSTFDADTLARIFAVLRTHGIGVPGDVAAAFRTLTSLEGAIAQLDPEQTLLAAVRSRLPQVLLKMAAPERVAAHTATQAGVAAAITRRLPGRVEGVSGALADGSFTLRTRSFADAEDRSWLRRQSDHALSAILGVTASVLAVLLVLSDRGAPVAGHLSVLDLVALGLGFCGLTLALRVVVRLFGPQDAGRH